MNHKNLPCRTRLVAILVLLLALGLSSAALAGTATAAIGMPFSGRWDQEGISSPGTHYPYHGWTYTEWATDIYASAGTDVKFHAYYEGIPWMPYVWGKVTAVANVPGCSADAGKYVAVDIYNVLGHKIGVVVYVHLDDVQVSYGQTVSSFQKLGKLKYWNYSNCWQVNFPAGTHVHMEFGSYTAGQDACWMNYSQNAWKSAGSYIARVGVTGTSSAASCP